MRTHAWLVAGAWTALGAIAVVAAEPRDLHHHLTEANRAQLVMLNAKKLVPADEAARIAVALRTVATEQDAPGAARSADYLVLEARLTELIGLEASNLHIGRSRNDLGATVNRMRMREETMFLLSKIVAARTALQQLAGEHVETVMPGFTHAVQAQPTTLAHYLLALDASLARDTARLREVYARINLSPLGAGAFTTSGFELDRLQLASLLGFDGLIENAYDAIIVSVLDSKAELASALSISALNIGRFAQDLVMQYDDPVPGLMLGDTDTGRSSIMPQKRNPSMIETLRVLASSVVGEAQTVTLYGHNTPLHEVRDVRAPLLQRLLMATAAARQMYETLERVLSSLIVRPETLRARVDADYSAMTELADTLHREAHVPFRTGYKAASELTTYGRTHGKRPRDLTHEEVAEVYRRVTGEALPLSAGQLQRALDPAEIVRSRKGRGGPQPAEIARMLEEQRRGRESTQTWLATETSRLERTSDELRKRFDALGVAGR